MKKLTQLFSKAIIFTVLVVLSFACQKKNFEDHVGPSICPSPNFQYEQQPIISQSTINLNTDTLKVNAKFNEEVPWEVTIKGLNSKSFKKFKGYGRILDVRWLGNPDTLVFFKAEPCEASVKVACTEPIVLAFTISTVNNFTNFGYLAFNWDAGSLGANTGGYGNPGVTTTINASLNSPQGGNCLCTSSGTYSGAPTWYFGGFDIILNNFAPKVDADPKNVYLNFFVNTKNSIATIPVIVINEGGVNRTKNIFVPNGGWQYVSIRLSDMNILNPKDISAVSFTLNSYPEQALQGDMCIDFVSFTNGSPFISQTVSASR